MNQQHNEVSGILFKIANLFTYSLISILIKISLAQAHTFQILFLLNISGFLITSSYLLFKKQKITSAIKINQFSVSRSIVYTFGIVFWVLALSAIPITEATAISYLTPIIIALFGIVFLKEKVNTSISGCLILGLVGMFIILKPFQNSIFLPGITFSVLSAIMWAVHDFIIKLQTKSEPWFQQSHTVFFFVSIFSLPLAIYTWEPVEMKYIALCISLGILTILNKFFLISALSKSKLVILAPINFFRLVFTAIMAYIVFGEVMEYDSAIGVVLIIISTSLMIRHSKNTNGGSGKS